MILTPGERLGSYTVVSVLGSGGMGEVYRAHDSKLGRDVAIKVLPVGMDSDEARLRRFALEGRAIAALNHPNIITVFDVASDSGRPYIATELIEGETLRDRMFRGALPLREAVDIAAQIADGLAHAHDARIVHRDLKPQNVMLKRDGLVKIVDFGLGKFLGALDDQVATATTMSGTPTLMGTIVGTAGYMSPEQVTGRPVDGRSDQFAFGALLYELLTGQRAFMRDTTIETISSVLSSEPKAIAAIAPATPAALVTVVERCLAKQPEARYASTRDLAHDLQQIRHDLIGTRNIPVRRVPVGRRTAAAAATALAVVVLGALGALVLTRGASAQTRQIAVLPFTNIQHDPANDAFADGIVELLTTNLTQLERSNDTLRVVPASDVRRYGVTSAREANQTFGASLVVSGSIQRSGETIRLTLNLIDPATLQQRSARVIDARAGDPLALQDQAFAVLAGMLGAGVQPETRTALRAGSTLVPGAYDYYVQGRGYLQRYERLENVNSAIDLFQRALRLDDRFALAQAGLGEALWRKYELTKETSLITDARAACAMAAALNDQSAAVHITLSLIARGTGEYEAAVAEASRALTIEPGSAGARRELAKAYESLGQFDRAEATYKQAIAAWPGDWSGYSALGGFYAARKRYDEALAQFRRVVELTPDSANGYSNLGGIQFFLRRYDDARVSFEKSVALRPTASALSNLGSLYFRLNRDEDAARTFERAVALDGADYRVWANLGSAWDAAGGAGQSERAYRKAAELAERERSVNPRSSSVVGDLSSFYAVLGDADKARSYARDALLLAPSDPSLMVTVAIAYKTLGDQPTAITWLAKAVAAGYPEEDLRQRRAVRDIISTPEFQVNVQRERSDTKR